MVLVRWCLTNIYPDELKSKKKKKKKTHSLDMSCYHVDSYFPMYFQK